MNFNSAHPTIIRNKLHLDHRGGFGKLFQSDMLPFEVRQVNFSFTTQRGTVRGVHFDRLCLEEKIVYCVQGKISDYAIDLENFHCASNSVHHFVLDRFSGGLFIPKGYGHCFQALTDDVAMVYLHNVDYKPENEGVFSIYSPMFNLNFTISPINLSTRDKYAEQYG